VYVLLGWLNKKAHRAGNWKRRWFVLALTDPPVTTPTSSSADVCTSAPIWAATLCYYKDASKRELKGSHILSSTSSIVGLDTDPHKEGHTHTKPHVKHAFRFKLLAAGSDVVLDADSGSDRLKWILAIESIVVDLRTHGQSQAQPVRDILNQYSLLSSTPSSGSSNSLQRTGSDLTDYMSRYNPNDPKHARFGFKLDKQHQNSLSASINDDANSHAKVSTQFDTQQSGDTSFTPTYTQIEDCADNDVYDECAEDCYYDRAGNIHSSLSVETNQSSEFIFRALSSEDGSAGDRTSVDSSANTHAQQPQTPTRRQTLTTTNTNNNNQSSPVKIQLTTEQRLQRVSESLLRAWMSDDLQSFQRCVCAQTVQAVIFSSEFTLSAVGLGNVWDLKGSTFSNPLGNYSVCSAVPVRTHIQASSHADANDDGGDEDSECVYTVWCEVFVLPSARSRNSNKQTRTRGGSSSSSSGTNTPTNSANLSIDPQFFQQTDIPGQAANNVCALEEYEVQLVFNSKHNKVSKLIFHRIDVRITDEATLKVQQAINESIVSLNNQQLQQQLNRSSRVNTQYSATSSRNYYGSSSNDETNDDSNDESGDDSDVVTGNDADVFAGIESLSKKNNRNRSRARSADSQGKGRGTSVPETLEEVVAVAKKKELELWKTTSRECGMYSYFAKILQCVDDSIDMCSSGVSIQVVCIVRDGVVFVIAGSFRVS
jgi:hypothetical protein